MAQSDRQMREVVDELSASVAASEPGRAPPLAEWLTEVLTQRRLPTGPVKDWPSFERRDPDFALAARLFLMRRELPLPADVPAPVLDYLPQDIPELSVLVPVLDRYVRHALRRSPHAADRELADRTVQRLRMLGVQITETGCQACASPVGRVLAYSRSKVEAIVPILVAEHRHLGRRLRAVVVADYEKSSATTAEIANLLDAEAGGAVAAFKHLVRTAETEPLNPVLVTGSSVLVDDDMWDSFRDAATGWLSRSSYDARLDFAAEDGFHVINGSGADWCPRVYVEMITELFQRGLTQCLVGTRGLLGEGWDANKINVLIDLTTVTTSMTVNQLRGRSIRLDPDEPAKLSDNWDVVCFAPEFTKGLDDYKRFLAKHETLFGVTEDGAVEKGAGHVHAAFATLKPEGLEDSFDRLNREMLDRVARRDTSRERWKVGQPYRGEPRRTIEAKPIGPRE
ncbi:MAG TPA: DEAD/DEAH box helicase, partial [Pirellulaceae bacterium]|nr:DEAD/DEAH box helicase [Pirellulaceae bacterium]